jgi:hypothetical protein
MSDRLVGCIFKVDRSIKHLVELNAAAERFAEADLQSGISFYGEPNEERTKYFIKAALTTRIPVLEWGVIVGDVVHALRSSLDQLVWLLSRDPSKDTAFPLCRTEKDWLIKSPGYLWGVDPTFVALIEDAQPYKSGDKAHSHPLAILGELSNLDKHRFLPGVGLMLASGDVRINGYQGIASCGQFRIKTGSALKQDAVIATARITPDGTGIEPEVDMHPELSFDMGFDRLSDIPSAIHAKPVIDVFAQFIGPYVSTLIHNIAELDGLNIRPIPDPT